MRVSWSYPGIINPSMGRKLDKCLIKGAFSTKILASLSTKLLEIKKGAWKINY